VEVDGTRVTRAGSPVMGRVTALHVHEGQRVEQGQLLATVSSTELSEGQLAFLKALSQGQVARRAVERARVLLKADVIGAAELQKREAELAELEAELEAARDQLELLGLAPESIAELEKTRRINSTSRILASLRGTVLARHVALGQVVQPADAAFEISDLSRLWLVADVPVAEAGGLFVGMPVEAAIGAQGEAQVRGKLAFVSSTVNEATRTVRVHLELANPQGRFKPAMLATMLLQGRTTPRPCVPLTAIVREEDREMVFVQNKPGFFTLRPVKLGPESAARRVLLEGVQAGETLVLDGAFHLNNERRRRAVRGSAE
jgi:cobalt-zinc-cadmium efflux system membrane fusion protein